MSHSILVNNARTITAAFTNNAGINTNPTTVTFKLKDPTGVVTTPAPTNPQTGVYAATVYFDIAGTWEYGWLTDEPYGLNFEDYVEVADSYFP